MPETTMISCGFRFKSAQAFWRAFRTPKSPHPGHQSGSTLPFKSAIAMCLVSARTVAIFCSPQTRISCAGTDSLDLPPSCSFTASTM